jgi:hypothetical protein
MTHVRRMASIRKSSVKIANVRPPTSVAGAFYLSREEDCEGDNANDNPIKSKRDEGVLADVIEEKFYDKRCNDKG